MALGSPEQAPRVGTLKCTEATTWGWCSPRQEILLQEREAVWIAASLPVPSAEQCSCFLQ